MEYVSPETFRRMVELGLIDADGKLTEEGQDAMAGAALRIDRILEDDDSVSVDVSFVPEK